MFTPAIKSSRDREGFTLIELLVAITIFAILATIAIASFSESGNDRVPAAARTLRSMLGGAQSRAAKDKAPRGVRLLVDPVQVDTATGRTCFVSSLVYIGANRDIEGTLPSLPANSGSSWVLTQASGDTVRWKDLVANQLLKAGQQVTLTGGDGTICTMLISQAEGDANGNGTVDSGEEIFTNMSFDDLIRVVGPLAPPRLSPVTYRLELAPEVLPNVEPVALPRNTVIDLDASALPASLRPSGMATAYANIDLVFSARGTMTGLFADGTVLSLYVGDVEDSQLGRPSPLGSPPLYVATAIRPRRLVTIFPATGQVVPSEYAEVNGSQFSLAIDAKEAK